MKIKTNITEEREVYIELPMFRKEKRTFADQIHNYFAVLPDKTVIDVFISGDLSIIKHWTAERMAHDIMTKKEWEEITEEEFLSAHQNALDSLSLSPQLSLTEKEIEQEMKDYDDLKNINI